MSGKPPQDLIEESSFNIPNVSYSDQPVIEHIWLGNCLIATAASNSPLASELTVFRAYRDNRLERFDAGGRFIPWYYNGGGRKWLRSGACQGIRADSMETMGGAFHLPERSS